MGIWYFIIGVVIATIYSIIYATLDRIITGEEFAFNTWKFWLFVLAIALLWPVFLGWIVVNWIMDLIQ